MNKRELEKQTQDLIRAHHDAFLVELLGIEGSGLLPDRIAELVEMGLITDKSADLLEETLTVTPILLVSMAGHIMDEYPDSRDSLRRLGADQWIPLVEEWESMQEEGDLLDITSPAIVPPAPISGRVVKVKPPEWMSSVEGDAHIRAYTRMGEYVRGLGDSISERIKEAPLADSVTKKDIQTVVGTLKEHKKQYINDLDLIAQTEMQGAHNEARALSAMEMAEGEEAYVARINNSDACATCKRLFREANGDHKVFSVTELEANGVNVGKSRENWLPTLFPIHPNCRCDTIPVPVGFRVDSAGRLFPRRGKETADSVKG